MAVSVTRPGTGARPGCRRRSTSSACTRRWWSSARATAAPSWRRGWPGPGRSVVVLERGSERHPGAFPDHFTEAGRHVQVHTEWGRLGSANGAVRLPRGARPERAGGVRPRRHVAHQRQRRAARRGRRVRRRALAGGAARRRPPPARPVLRAGRAHARLAPLPRPAPTHARRCRRWARVRSRCGSALERPPLQRHLLGRAQRGRAAPGGVHPVRRLLLGLQRRRQEHGARPTTCPTRTPTAPASSPRWRSSGAPRRRPVAGRRPAGHRWAAPASLRRHSWSAADVVVLAAGTLGSTEILLRSREAGLAAVRPGRRALQRQRRRARLRPRHRHRRRRGRVGGQAERPPDRPHHRRAASRCGTRAPTTRSPSRRARSPACWRRSWRPAVALRQPGPARPRPAGPGAGRGAVGPQRHPAHPHLPGHEHRRRRRASCGSAAHGLRVDWLQRRGRPR